MPSHHTRAAFHGVASFRLGVLDRLTIAQPPSMGHGLFVMTDPFRPLVCQGRSENM